MAQQVLNNGETYGVHRGKINANETELYANVASASAAATSAASTASAAIPATQKGAASGVATLDGGTKVPLAQISAVLAVANLTDGAALNTTVAGNSTTIATHTTAIAGKISVPLGWNGTTPALSSGTNPVTAGFGSNSFVVTTANSTTLDGISAWAVNDIAIFGAAGASTWSKIAAGATLAALTDIATYDLGVNNTSVAAIKATANAAAPQSSLNTTNANVTANTASLAQLGKPLAISTSTTLAATPHNGENLVCASTPALTVNTGLVAGFGCSIKGTFSTAGSATITDLRSTTGTAFCCLVQSDTTGAGATYDLVGTK